MTIALANAPWRIACAESTASLKSLAKEQHRYVKCCPRLAMARRVVQHLPLDMARKKIFSGIQPTGVPHLGNYLGALREWVKLQNNGDFEQAQTFSVVDLHALTAHPVAEVMQRDRRVMLASLLAVGLDPKRSTIYFQSSIPAHSELMWILSCHASFGALNRMTQWKTKTEGMNANTSNTQQPRQQLGLFSYPVLQAADVLLLKSTHIPVGEDQQQHIEFVRDLAISFNHACKTQEPLFEVPEAIVSPAKRVMSLTDPSRKMSKSDTNPASRILINDTRETIIAKIKGALTDSFDGISYEPQKRPGVANLLSILSHLDRQKRSCETIAKDCENLSMRAFKEHVSAALEECFAPIREKYEVFINRANHLDYIARSGADAVKNRSKWTMMEVKVALGLENWHGQRQKKMLKLRNAQVKRELKILGKDPTRATLDETPD